MKYPSLKDSAIYAGIVLITAGIVFFGLSVSAKYNDLKDEVKSLTATVEARDGQIADLESTLSQTEEGKKAAEDAKSRADANAASQAKRANNAEAGLASANAQLSSVNAQLNTANTQLAGVNRCISLFGTVKPKIEDFKLAVGNQNDAANSGNYILAGMFTDRANVLWQQIWPTMDRISTGYCY